MKVFIGNATKQHLAFVYRLPERKAAITQQIPMGTQKKLTEDMSQLDIDAIMDQWGKYGLIPYTELEAGKIDFSGYLIAVNNPIPGAVMDTAVEYRADVLRQLGREQRELAALEMVRTIERTVPTPATQYEMSVAEEIPQHGFQNPADSHTAEGWRINNDRPNMPETPRGGRRRAA